MGYWESFGEKIDGGLRSEGCLNSNSKNASKLLVKLSAQDLAGPSFAFDMRGAGSLAGGGRSDWLGGGHPISGD